MPNRIFFTGVPGSRWSGIAQIIESIPGMNTSDRSPEREYVHHNYTGHKGSYFGPGMEFEPLLDSNYIDQAWNTSQGCKLVKSHEWAYYLKEIRKKFPNDLIMLIYRQDMISYSWWHEAGGFQIQYPNYKYYKNSVTILNEIIKQNSCILEFGMLHKCVWEYFTSEWIYKNFGTSIVVNKTFSDILVTLI